MKRRAPRTNTRSHSNSREHSANHCRAMVLVDGARTRKKIKQDYEKALRDLDHSRAQLDQFHQEDLPGFTRWLSTRFGAQLTEIRGLSQELAADEEILFRVHTEVFLTGVSHARAWQRVMELRENPAPPAPPGGSGEPDGEGDPFGARPEPAGFDGGDDPLEELFEEMFDKMGAGEGPRGEGARRSGRHPGAARPLASSRLKELYRALVRRLHPDTQREMTAQKSEWWHQAQAAYEAGDVEQLEVILTLCEIGDSGTTAHTSASLLQRITAKLKSSLREIKRQIAARRRDPAWNFSRRSDHDGLADRIGRQLMHDLEMMRERCRQTREVIAGWKAAAERLKRPRRRKPRPHSIDFPF